jgi:hypothetical protein
MPNDLREVICGAVCEARNTYRENGAFNFDEFVTDAILAALAERGPSDAMVEAVARAIALADEQNGGWPYEKIVLEKYNRASLFDRARAAIEAYRAAMLAARTGQPEKETR